MSNEQKLPTCEKCRRETVCVKVEAAIGDEMHERTLCLQECFPLWRRMNHDLQKRVSQMLREHHEDFFDIPTRNDLPKQ